MAKDTPVYDYRAIKKATKKNPFALKTAILIKKEHKKNLEKEK